MIAKTMLLETQKLTIVAVIQNNDRSRSSQYTIPTCKEKAS